MSKATDLYSQFAAAMASVGACHLGTDTCCRLMAIVYVYGGSSENFTLVTKLRTDWEYAARHLHIGGAGTPDPDVVEAIKGYVAELEADIRRSEIGECKGANFSRVCHVGWACRLMRERYGMNTLLN